MTPFDKWVADALAELSWYLPDDVPVRELAAQAERIAGDLHGYSQGNHPSPGDLVNWVLVGYQLAGGTLKNPPESFPG